LEDAAFVVFAGQASHWDGLDDDGGSLYCRWQR